MHQLELLGRGGGKMHYLRTVIYGRFWPCFLGIFPMHGEKTLFYAR